MKKLYLKDDQPITHFITKKFLQVAGHKGSIQEYTKPRVALRDLKEETSALILLDLQMPEMTGWDFLEEMIEHNLKFETVILTSSTSSLDLHRAQNYTFILNYMIKPLNQDKIKLLMNLCN